MFSCLLVAAFTARAEEQGLSLFSGTFYPLQVYYIQGEEPGPTVMVQGGIQGDEPAGVLTAAILRQGRVKKGNLILIPRANVPALNRDTRQINVDLNRRFDRNYARFYEDILARAIKYFAAGSDGLVHLHEGSGFYCPEYVDSSRNPNRFGQSVIIDCAAYSGVPDLGKMARRAIDRVNPQVIPRRYVFSLFNTQTFAQNTKHSEQRKSLTFHTVSNLRKPALAVEVSKEISDLGWKVKQQTAMVRELLSNMGVELQPPKNVQALADSWYDGPLPLEVNGEPLEGRQSVDLKRFSILRAGFTRSSQKAWSVSPSGMPEVNLLTSEFIPLTGFDSLHIRVDGRKVKEIAVNWSGPEPEGAGNTSFLVYSLNGRVDFCMPGGEIRARPGDSFFIIGLWGEKGEEVLNVKGFVSDPVHNDGQDKHSRFVLFKDRFMDRYIQSDSKGFKARIVRETPGEKEIKWHLRVQSPPTPELFCRKERVWQKLDINEKNIVDPGGYTLTSRGEGHILFSVPGQPGPVKEPRLDIALGQEFDLEIIDSRTFSSLGSLILRAGEKQGKSSRKDAGRENVQPQMLDPVRQDWDKETGVF